MIQVTEKAAKKIRELLTKEGISERGGLRLGVQGGGCSGFQYALGFDRGDAALAVAPARQVPCAFWVGAASRDERAARAALARTR